MDAVTRRLRIFVLPWVALIAVGLVVGCASGDGGTVAQPAAAAGGSRCRGARGAGP